MFKSFLGSQNSLRVLYNHSQTPGSVKKASRHIPQVPERILDAPDILDDYCKFLIPIYFQFKTRTSSYVTAGDVPPVAYRLHLVPCGWLHAPILSGATPIPSLGTPGPPPVRIWTGLKEPSPE